MLTIEVNGYRQAKEILDGLARRDAEKHPAGGAPPVGTADAHFGTGQGSGQEQ